jgi:hypothetical protein
MLNAAVNGEHGCGKRTMAFLLVVLRRGARTASVDKRHCVLITNTMHWDVVRFLREPCGVCLPGFFECREIDFY